MVAVAAAVLAGMIWTQPSPGIATSCTYRTQVLQAAADWTGVLINMNKDTVEAEPEHAARGDRRAAQLDFETIVEPYRKLVRTLQARTTGQIDSVASRVVPSQQARRAGRTAPQPDSAFSARTDTVTVVATSISENAGTDKPQTVRWTLRLDVSDVDGKLLISRLEPIR